MSLFWKIANAFMLLAFVASVVVQFNDPDPWRWVLVYGAAAVACLVAFRPGSGPALPAIVGLAAIAWAAWLAPAALGHVGFGELFEAFEMKDTRVEVGREFGGLLIIVAWMAVLAGRALRNRRRAGAPAG
jgi:hypothetical protein